MCKEVTLQFTIRIERPVKLGRAFSIKLGQGTS